ncbi:MAG: polysaccharide deacetylase family protein, partial [Gammaproteobacteria bacterium]|nr:polysaccharide deacetylase family protein [Gammaproteobacteria bacterium]
SAMNTRPECRSIIALLVSTTILAWSCGTALSAQSQEEAFPGLSGPLQETVLPDETIAPTDPGEYHNPGSNNLAIFLRDPQSSWLGLAHGLKSIGLPFSITTNLEEALSHGVMLIYPRLTGANSSPELLQKLQRYVSEGNSLIAFSVIGGGMKGLFGYDGYQERNDLQTLRFNDNELVNEFVLDPAESSVNLADNNQRTGGVSYSGLSEPAIASFDDDSGAIIFNTFGSGPETGYAYAIGFDLSHFTLRAFNGRLTGVVEDYVNAYHPKVDSLLRFIAAAYRQGENDSITVLSTPFNKDLTVLITHDIDYTRSLSNIDAYAQLENQLGVPATYFLQTKYVKDYNDMAFFDVESGAIVQQIEHANIEIGSHSVAHSNEFRSMPLGSGQERYPEYQPFVKDFGTVHDASISGELRISKFLLEHLIDYEVTAFRPGHLSFPRKLPEMLQAHGYRYSSSITANEALTHFPYQTMFAGEYQAETPVYEFPITIEDEQSELWSRLDQSIELANKIARHRGLVNVLIHTDETGQKLEFEREFIEEFKDRAWFSTVSRFGDWWRIRDSVQINVHDHAAGLKEVKVKADGTIEGLSLRIPVSWQLEGSVDGVRQIKDVLIFDQISGATEISVRVR